MSNLNYIELLLLGLMAAVVALAGAARRFAVSYPIVLVVAGLLCSLLPHVPRVPLPPEIVFSVFLPPLLFAAAWQTSWREFRFNLVSIGMLAIGLVFFTAFGVALTAHFFMNGFDWRLGFLLGAVVSPTDAVAATSIARRVGMPGRIVDLLEGESLVNDATGLLALQFGVQMITEGTTPHLGHATLEFLWLLGGGVGVGLLVAVVVIWAEEYVDDGPVEIVLSLLVAYGSYLAGEAVHASGVISTVTCGLYMSRKSSTFFSPSVRLQAVGVWDALEFLLNGLVFILLGLQLPYVLAGIKGYSFGQLLAYGLGFSAVLIALRLLWMFPAAQIAYKIRTQLLHQNYQKPTTKGVFVIGWTGMRGVVALAAAGSLPYTLGNGDGFPERNIIVFLTFSVILVTLVLQGLSLPAMIRLLGMNGDEDLLCEEGEARRIILRSALNSLHEGRKLAHDGAAHAYEDVIHQYEHRLEDVENCGPDTENANPRVSVYDLMLEAIRRERQELIELRNTGRIGDSVHRVLEHELDLSESRLAAQLER